MTIPDAPVPSLLSATPRQSLRRGLLRWEWFLVALIGVVVVINSRLSPYFLDVTNLFRASSDFMEIGLMMLPMALIIVTGNVDLAVASTLGMSASLMGVLFNSGWDIWPAAGAALLLGLAGGLLNGALIARLKVPALVITLGTYAFYRGLAFVMLGDQAARNYPAAFNYLGQGTVLGTPVPFSMLLFGVMALIFGLVLHQTAFGRYLYAIGSNQEAVIYSGVPVARIKIILFAVSGAMAALAGLVLAARFGSTRPDIGTGLELSVITATVLGGVDINGGKGSLPGAMLALLLVGLMRFGMGLLSVQAQVQGIVIGSLLVLSILLPNLPRIARAQRAGFSWRAVLGLGLLVALALALVVLLWWVRGIVLAL